MKRGERNIERRKKKWNEERSMEREREIWKEEGLGRREYWGKIIITTLCQHMTSSKMLNSKGIDDLNKEKLFQNTAIIKSVPSQYFETI